MAHDHQQPPPSPLPLPPPPSSSSSPLLLPPPDSNVPQTHVSASLPHSLSLSLPPSRPLPSDRHFREDCWSEGATNTLIDAWGDRYLDLNRGNLKQKHWKDVADSVNVREDGKKPIKTDVQCKNRLDTLKKKYKLEKAKIVTGGGPSKWTFYEKLDELLGPSKKQNKVSDSPLKITPAEKEPVEESLQKPFLLQKPILYNDINANFNNLNGCILFRRSYHNTNANIYNVTTDTFSKSKESPDMTVSSTHELFDGVDGKAVKKRRMSGSPFKDLARAVLKFGEVYKRVESAKQQQILDLEKHRMEFTKDLELQRMHLFMQTQLEIAKIKYGKEGNPEHYR